MKHIMYALFRDPVEAEAAQRDIKSAGLENGQYHLVFHRGQINENDLHPSEGDGWKGLLTGIGAGALCGLIVGWLLHGPLQILPLSLFPSLLLGLLAGVVFGGLGGALFGAGLTDRNLKDLSDRLRHGEVLLTAETENLRARDIMDQIFKQHGATLA